MMNLYKPKLKKRVDGSSPKLNKIYGEIESCLQMYPNDTFHFFSDNKGNVRNVVWKLFLLKNDCEFNLEKFKSEINENELYLELKRLNSYGLNLEYVVFNDSLDWNKNPHTIYVITCRILDKKIIYNLSLFTISEFQKLLFKYQKTSMIMNKPLTYSKTELEGYLADQCQRKNKPINKCIFPGDVDFMIVSKDKIKALIEFKKHSLSSPLIEESYRKYWFKDKKKYHGIAAMTRKLKLNYFYNIIYPTKVDIDKIKIEKIKSNGFFDSFSILKFKNKKELEDLLENYFKTELHD